MTNLSSSSFQKELERIDLMGRKQCPSCDRDGLKLMRREIEEESGIMKENWVCRYCNYMEQKTLKIQGTPE
jgi:C4-type Zn-finger protein